MCNKNNIPTTEEKCRETRCNSIDNDLEPTHSYTYNIDKSTSDASKEKVGRKNTKLYFVSMNLFKDGHFIEIYIINDTLELIE